ncbi:helix-turn-helix domain-containing protein [Spirosoma montaniterrae]|uniref:AraC family transcriptional regulator n=1 Tax=Spirosoma montaniterrae TaxID=1178516 RepID=A0A1P9WUX6_9BACT|nr:AraC family transcriptional regulator [Spirosoma montaniterrae]AQG79130.1 AraC family transcriptional regulator [Spirosoma montaniterrae]
MKILPPQLDVFALIMLLGVAQGIFLGIFFLTGERGRTVANRCLGWFMLAISAVTAEIFLGYTNYMFRVLWLVDFSEQFNFLVGPLFYFFVYARLYDQLPKRWVWHLVPFSLWCLNAITWFYQPVEFKYNAYISAYHPELSFVRFNEYIPHDFTELRDYVSELTLLSCFIYSMLSMVAVWQAYRQAGRTLGQFVSVQLTQLRNLAILNLTFPLLIVVVKPQFEEDLGDYILACYVTVLIYTTCFLVMRGSDFFRTAPMPALVADESTPTVEPKRKYEKSALSEELEEAVLIRLARLLDTEKPYLQADLSLPKLAERLQTSPHHLSQLLNDRLGQSFFDWLAAHRIAEAQQLLNNSATAHLKIDEIAERVGYNSPSAFHTAFKRITGQTPAQFRASLSA